MTYLLAAEWIKLRKRWMPRIIVIIMLAIIALIFWGIGTSSSQRINLFMPRGWVIALYMAASFAPFIWPVLGGSWAGSEYSWGTVRLVLSRRPDRVRWLAAALIVLILAALVALLLTLVLGALAGAVVAFFTGNPAFDTIKLPSSYPGIAFKMFLATWYILAFFLVLSYTLGTIFRSGAVGIGGGIGISVAQLVISGIFNGLGGRWKEFAAHLPYAYTSGLPDRLISEGTSNNFIGSLLEKPSIPECIIGLAVYMVILLAIAVAVVRTRDVTS